jgi:hypothetical protein
MGMKNLRFWIAALLCSLLASGPHAALYNPPSSGSTPTNVPYVHVTSAGSTDIGSGATSETVVYDWTMPALGTRSSAYCQIQFTGSGTGNKVWRGRIGGTGIDGTQLWTTTSGSANGQLTVGFLNVNSTSAQAGMTAGTGGINTGTGASATGTATSATGVAGVHFYITVAKATGADVVTTQGVRCMVTPTV